MLHRFVEQASRVVKPLIVDNNPYAGLSQLLWSDAIFIRDITRLDVLTPAQLLKIALILHVTPTGPSDVALRAAVDPRCHAWNLGSARLICGNWKGTSAPEWRSPGLSHWRIPATLSLKE